MKPTYPQLLKAFKFSMKKNPSKEEVEFILDTIKKLRSSQDWKDEDDKSI